MSFKVLVEISLAQKCGRVEEKASDVHSKNDSESS